MLFGASGFWGRSFTSVSANEQPMNFAPGDWRMASHTRDRADCLAVLVREPSEQDVLAAVSTNFEARRRREDAGARAAVGVRDSETEFTRHRKHPVYNPPSVSLVSFVSFVVSPR